MTMKFSIALPSGQVPVFALAGMMLACTLLSPLARAEQAAAGIEPFTGAEVAYSSTGREVRTHSVPVDRISRVDGFMQPRTAREVRGRLSSITWRHPRGVTSEAVFMHLRSQLRGEPWYECQSRDCGPSTYWAHRQFEVADLYGGDGTQFYVAVPRATAAGPVLTMLYVVQRGTREVLAHVAEIVMEQTEAATAAPDRMAHTLLETGVVRLPMVFTADGEADGDIGPLLEGLGQAASGLSAALELWLVVHLRDRGRGGEATLAASRDRAERLAARVAEAVPDRTVAGYGVGALIPGVLGDEDAVVQIVVQQPAD
ncbi:MAG: DUF4892 domain-containing protein [Gammaproteobacteria bacterium]|nr:DUF4892 domain-containing protein [Gammaproteobacteria bacterium]